MSRRVIGGWTGAACRRGAPRPPGRTLLRGTLVRLALLAATGIVAPAALAQVPQQPQQPIAPAAPGGPWLVPDELWDRPRSAGALRGQPAIRAAVLALLATPGASLVIRHGRGQNDEARADELRQWLVALAIEGTRITVAPVAPVAPAVPPAPVTAAAGPLAGAAAGPVPAAVQPASAPASRPSANEPLPRGALLLHLVSPARVP